MVVCALPVLRRQNAAQKPHLLKVQIIGVARSGNLATGRDIDLRKQGVGRRGFVAHASNSWEALEVRNSLSLIETPATYHYFGKIPPLIGLRGLENL